MYVGSHKIHRAVENWNNYKKWNTGLQYPFSLTYNRKDFLLSFVQEGKNIGISINS